jgi:hypothetical protein
LDEPFTYSFEKVVVTGRMDHIAMVVCWNDSFKFIDSLYTSGYDTCVISKPEELILHEFCHTLFKWSQPSSSTFPIVTVLFHLYYVYLPTVVGEYNIFQFEFVR